MAETGKLGTAAKGVWNFFDGWKTWIWAVMVAAKMLFPALPFWGYIDATASALGWNQVAPAIDPGALVQWVTFAIAVGHKLMKAIAEYRAGTPVQNLLSGK